MSGNFRKTILSWGAKILLALLIISFGLWGIGDYISGGGKKNEAVAKIGSRQITSLELETQVADTVTRMRQIFGQNFTEQQAFSMGIVDQTLNKMIQEQLFLEGAHEAGLVISEQLLGDEIRRDKEFHNNGGQFDRATFNQVIHRAGLTETGFSSLYRRELLQKQLLSTINLGLAVPTAMIENIYRYRNERRVLEMIRISHASFKEFPPPNPANIARHYKDNSAAFTAPEYRTLTVLRLRPEDVADEIDVPEVQIKDEYEDRISEFSQKEQRNIQQILVSDKETAEKAVSRLNSGENFFEVAKDLTKLEKDSLDLGNLTRKQLPFTELADVAFLLTPYSHSQPIKTSLGWHVLRVGAIIPASRKSFSEVREQLKRSIQLSKAADTLVSLANKLEDEFGSGARIGEAARRLNLKIEKIPAIDVRGLDKIGNTIEGISDNQNILQTAFQTAEGEDSDLNEYGTASYFILHVDNVIPPTLRPLEQIRTQVVEAWKKEHSAKLAEQRAKGIVEQLNGGKTSKIVAKEQKLSLIVTQPFTRASQGLQISLPPELISKAFRSKVGQAVWVAGNEAHFAARVTKIKKANFTRGTIEANAIRSQLIQSTSNDLTAQFAEALRARVGVTIKREAISMYNSGGSE